MKKIWETIALWLLIVGGFNWGLTIFNNFNLLGWLTGFLPATFGSWVLWIVYLLVGVSAVFMAIRQFNK